MLSAAGFNWNPWTLVFINILVIIKADDLQLKLVQLLFRHGDRSPTETYPTDPWKDAWPDGFGQLTTLGMNQQFEMGKYLRQRYGKLINETYNHNTVVVRSTNRLRQSRWFYPPEGRHVWNKNLPWQPIPVHTIPVEEDYLLSLDSICPKYDKLFEEQINSPEAKKINAQYKELFEFLTNKTGVMVKQFDDASEFYDIFLIDQIHNHSLPSWANTTVIGRFKKV
uniref:acid phosphatase n=1 Tax=Strigamia maritima TaxID=126957 RepID=T1IKD9_STRMM